MMRSTALLTLSLAALVAGGCVSKSDYQDVQAQLAACQEEKASAQAGVLAWEERYDRETNRWNEMEASITDAVPKALVEFQSEKERILELVPEQVKFEVETYLEDYFNTLMKGFDLLQKDNQDIKMQLSATQKVLENVGADTRSIGLAIDDSMAVEQEKREQVAAKLAELVAEVAKFDSSHINCKGCPDRLSLSKKEREAILGFHGEMMLRLSELQTFSGE